MGAPSYLKLRALVTFCAAALSCPLPALAPVALAAPAQVREPSALAEKKDTGAAPPARPFYATLTWVHDGTTLAIDDAAPDQARFERLVADRISGERLAMDPRLLELLRTVAKAYPHARLELVSGFRSPKFNEMLRKKGHKVANQSQHSEGHAVDFRIIPEGQTAALDPFDVELWLRHDLHWPGGIGVYPTQTDRFVHADVGKERRWVSR